MRVLTGDEGLTYYEGLVDSLVPVPHAWAQTPDGRVVELTLRHKDGRCGFCYGDGEVHPTDHWDYDHDSEDDYGYEGDDEPIVCEQCGGTGKTEPRDLTGTKYLGVPIPADVLRAALTENGVWGVLFEDPERVAACYTNGVTTMTEETDR